MIEILQADLSPMEDLDVPGLEAGQDSGSVAFALRNSGDEDRRDLLVILQVWDAGAGTWVSQGLPPQDELWGRIRLTGQESSAAPSQQDLHTDWQPIGANSALAIPDVLAGGIRYGEIRMHPPGSAAELGWRWQLAVLAADGSRPVPPAATAARRGILTGVGDPSRGGLIRGCEVLASSSDSVTVAPGLWLHRGRIAGKVGTDHVLDQTDAAAAALAAGESYIAVLSLGAAGVNVTKGAKGVSPTSPAAPAGDVVLRPVQVRYGAGGSEIETTDLLGEVVYDRYLALPGAGLELRVHAGQALGGATWRQHSRPRNVPLQPDETHYVWQLATGDLSVTLTDEAPETTALGPWWEVDTDGAGVVDLRDRRSYAEDAVLIRLAGALGVPGEIASALAGEGLALEAILYRLSDNGGGSAGQTVLDVEINGASIYVSQATDDQRPAWAWDASTPLILSGGPHELTRLAAGDVVTLVSAEHPTGGTPALAEACLICRRTS